MNWDSDAGRDDIKRIGSPGYSIRQISRLSSGESMAKAFPLLASVASQVKRVSGQNSLIDETAVTWSELTPPGLRLLILLPVVSIKSHCHFQALTICEFMCFSDFDDGIKSHFDGFKGLGTIH